MSVSRLSRWLLGASAPRRAPRPRLDLMTLEARDVPALWAVDLTSGAIKDEAMCTVIVDDLVVNPSLDQVDGVADGVAIVEADSERQAIERALTGLATVDSHIMGSEYSDQTYKFIPDEVAAEASAFQVQPIAGGWRVFLEDLYAYEPPQGDRDYDDHWWDVTAVPVTRETVAGRVWSDDNEDGIQDDTEAGIAGRDVQLLKDGTPFGDPVQTGDDGEYSIEVYRFPNTKYTVEFSKPEGYEFTTPIAGDDRTRDSDANEDGVTPEVFTSSTPQGAVGGGLVIGAMATRWTVRARETAEGNGPGPIPPHQMTFTVKQNFNVGVPATVNYTTIDGTATVADRDYVKTEGVLNFPASIDQLTVTVEVLEDTKKENDEEFFLVLKFPTFVVMPDGTTEEGRRTPFGRGIIRNDDFPAGYVDTWAGWGVDPHNSVDQGTNYENGTWMRGWDGNTPTYITPAGTPWVHSMIAEGPYLKSTAKPGSLRYAVEWRALDTVLATPMFPTGEYRFNKRAEHFGNSGVYIYDRYEVQVVDPSKAPGGAAGVPIGGNIVARDGSEVGALVLGWPYLVKQPNGPYVNRANPTGVWNTMVIEFDPGTIDPTNPKQLLLPAWLKVTLNGQQVFRGTIAANGTGNNRAKLDPLVQGSLFLQSHWGSLVEYKNPVLEAVVIKRSTDSSPQGIAYLPMGSQHQVE